MTNDELVPSEDMPRPIVRHIAFLTSLFVDLLLSLMSIQIVIFSYFGQTPSSTQWGFALTGAQAAVLFLFLVPLGFVTSWRLLSQVRDDVRNEGFVLISPQRLMVVLGMPFVFIAGALALLLSLIGIGLPFYPTAWLFYGFGLGMVIARTWIAMTDLKIWMISPMYADSDIKRRRAAKWKITVQQHVSSAE
ncbi:MAG: hypothetical protein RTV31_14945 [Candidatus Thorarchaeota archaeon]